ncbi:DUF4857 domain-containing protein [Campylobacter sp.]|uniref:DUF4857 domain-containing protein n=1 Tax=Campylobacter sp. TaxID=205 RepID=UPI002704C6DB|nr:DUF4857 domain-containing protein [Campylobacter sp.]
MRALKFIYFIATALVLNFFITDIAFKFIKDDEVEARIKYSPVLDDFIISIFNISQKTTTHSLKDGKILSEDELVFNMPFEFYHYLSVLNSYPPKFDFFFDDISLITENSQTIDVKRLDFKFKQPPLYILFESNPKMLKLRYPDELLEFNDRADFIDMQNISINKEKSQKLNLSLKNAGFSFPAKGYYAQESAIKAFDEGAFAVDSEDKIFHIKQINGEFLIKDTKIVKNDLIYIKMDENLRREFYALVVGKDYAGLISYEDYSLINLPTGGLDPRNFDTIFEVTPLHKILTYENENLIKIYVLNPDYTYFKEFEYVKTHSRKFSSFTRWFFVSNLFLEIKDYKFSFVFKGINFEAFVVSFLLCLFYFTRTKKIFESIFILFFGIIGVVTILFLKENDK